VQNGFFLLGLVYGPGLPKIFSEVNPKDLGFLIKTEKTHYYDPGFCNGRSYQRRLYSDLCPDKELYFSVPGTNWAFYAALDQSGESMYYVEVYEHRDETWCDDSNYDKATLVKIRKIQ